MSREIFNIFGNNVGFRSYYIIAFLIKEWPLLFPCLWKRKEGDSHPLFSVNKTCLFVYLFKQSRFSFMVIRCKSLLILFSSISLHRGLHKCSGGKLFLFYFKIPALYVESWKAWSSINIKCQYLRWKILPCKWGSLPLPGKFSQGAR